MELMRWFAICRCGMPGRQWRCVVEVLMVMTVELTTKFDIPRRDTQAR